MSWLAEEDDAGDALIFFPRKDHLPSRAESQVADFHFFIFFSSSCSSPVHGSSFHKRREGQKNKSGTSHGPYHCSDLWPYRAYVCVYKRRGRSLCCIGEEQRCLPCIIKMCKSHSHRRQAQSTDRGWAPSRLFLFLQSNSTTTGTFFPFSTASVHETESSAKVL